MRKDSHSAESRDVLESGDRVAGDFGRQSEVVLKILADAEPDGIGNDEFRRSASEKGINEKMLNDILKPLIQYANIYFNADKGKYHYMWSPRFNMNRE